MPSAKAKLRLSPIKRDDRLLSPITEERESGLSDLSRGNNWSSLLGLSHASQPKHHKSLQFEPQSLSFSHIPATKDLSMHHYKEPRSFRRSSFIEFDPAENTGGHTYEEINETDNESRLGPIPADEVHQKMSTILHGSGQLHLAIYMQYGMLTIHVIQARRLEPTYNSICVKIALLPDTEKQTKLKTKIIVGSKKPLFDEKFSYELLDEDMNKRIFISTWDKDPRSGKSEFLGCMSFGLASLETQGKEVNGWFYLLREKIGRRKHLRAPDHGLSMRSTHPNVDCNSTYGATIDIDTYDEEHVWWDHLNLIVKRSIDGWGFAVTGGDPVEVSHVEEDGAAYRGGLRPHDCILTINGINVLRSSSQTVAKIVRQSSRQVNLAIKRPRNFSQQRAQPPPGHYARAGNLRVVDNNVTSQSFNRSYSVHHGSRRSRSIIYVSDAETDVCENKHQRSFFSSRRSKRSQKLSKTSASEMDFDIYQDCDSTPPIYDESRLTFHATMEDRSRISVYNNPNSKSTLESTAVKERKKRHSLSMLFHRGGKENKPTKADKPKKQKLKRNSSVVSISGLLARLNKSLHHYDR